MEDLRRETNGCGHTGLKIVNFKDSWNEVDELFLPSVNHVFFFLSFSLSSFFFFTANARCNSFKDSRRDLKRFSRIRISRIRAGAPSGSP